MPRGRSTSTKRQKEQARQQKQRENAERRSLRKQERPGAPIDEDAEMRANAAAQAAHFNIGLGDES